MEPAGDDLYSILNLPPASTDDQLRTAFCELLQKYHPDRNPDAIEMATRKTQEIIMAYSQLRDWRKRSLSSRADVSEINISFTVEAPGISLDLIASLKQEFHDAWNAFNKKQYDVMAALRLIRAAFDAGRPDVVDGLVTNPQLIDAASILARVFSTDDAVHLGLMWSESLRTKRFPEAAIQILSDLNRNIPTDSLYASQIRDALRSLHYGIAQGHNSEQKPVPAKRIHHLRAILDLGFELSYVFKQLADAHHDLGDDDAARTYLHHAIKVDPQLGGAKKIMRALGMASENAPKARRKQRRDEYAHFHTDEVPTCLLVSYR
jgi:tetratricopeptide (TPR) repeat protein